MVEYNVVENKGKLKVDNLLQIMKVLRGPGGCPWDREQTYKSIRNEVLEEAYEVCDAIDQNDKVSLCEELGDLLLQVVFHSTMAEELGDFDFDDVTNGICKKLILRHPHVFKDAKAENSAQVLDMWDEIKKQEKNQESYTDTLKSVPAAFPALMRAAKVEKRASKGGVEIDNSTEVLLEKIKEMETAAKKEDKSSVSRIYGQLLFALASLQRKYDINCEEALNTATSEFVKKFEAAENKAKEKNTMPTPEEIGQAFDEI